MSYHKKYHWFKIADSVEQLNWQSNNMCVVEVKNKKITLVKVKEQVFACAHKCPHAGGNMADGFIDAAGNIVCPLHRYKFSLANGRNVSGEGYFLKNYAIEHRSDGIFAGFEEKGMFNWL
jgi:3-phenylpropionate/trans-cinnamate dioxygenase ferredoxin subunit